MYLFLSRISEGDSRELGPVAINFSQVQKFIPFDTNTLIFFSADTTVTVKESWNYIKEKINENI